MEDTQRTLKFFPRKNLHDWRNAKTASLIMSKKFQFSNRELLSTSRVRIMQISDDCKEIRYKPPGRVQDFNTSSKVRHHASQMVLKPFSVKLSLNKWLVSVEWRRRMWRCLSCLTVTSRKRKNTPSPHPRLGSAFFSQLPRDSPTRQSLSGHTKVSLAILSVRLCHLFSTSPEPTWQYVVKTSMYQYIGRVIELLE